jgi:hypothetical protein
MCDRDEWQQVGRTALKVVEKLAGGSYAESRRERLDAGRVARPRGRIPSTRNLN